MSLPYLKNRGFTLIELLVVISIIGLLSSIILAGLTQARKKADEAAVLSSMHQIQNALELYRLNTGNYPSESGSPFNLSGGVGGGAGVSGFYADSVSPGTYSSPTCTTDDFHCIMGYFLVNNTTKFIPNIFRLPGSFQASDFIGYYVPKPSFDNHTNYCNGTPTKNYYIFISAPDHASWISTLQDTWVSLSTGAVTTVGNMGCLGG